MGADILQAIISRLSPSQDPEQAQRQAIFQRNQGWAKPALSYQTALPPQAEGAFQDWVKRNQIPFDPNDPQSDYDMRGYWRDVVLGGNDQTAMNQNDGRRHYPDTYKTPYHQSFSAESRYATKYAPVWINDHQFADPHTGQVIFDERSAR